MTGSVSKLISESDFGFTARLLRMEAARETVQQMEYTGNRPSQTRSSIRR